MLLQAPRRWVSSPLGLNILLALCGSNNTTVQKYVQISKLLKTKKEFNIKNILYQSSCVKSDDIIKNKNIDNDIALTGILEEYYQWVQKHSGNLEEEFPTTTKLILSNICNFKGHWNLSKDASGPIMKIYNSFNYTQDVKYEARILELPVQNNDFKLAIIIPNEADVLHNLFKKLNEEGLTAAINSIQPLFTVTSELQAPSIEVVSKVELSCENINPIMSTAVQQGTVRIDQNGVLLQVSTSMYSPSIKTPPITDNGKVENPFYIAITYHDTAIFTGQYTQ